MGLGILCSFHRHRLIRWDWRADFVATFGERCRFGVGDLELVAFAALACLQLLARRAQRQHVVGPVLELLDAPGHGLLFPDALGFGCGLVLIGQQFAKHVHPASRQILQPSWYGGGAPSVQLDPSRGGQQCGE